MIARIERIAPLKAPSIPSEADALHRMRDVGDYDQWKLKRFKRREVEAMKAEGFTWDEETKMWVR